MHLLIREKLEQIKHFALRMHSRDGIRILVTLARIQYNCYVHAVIDIYNCKGIYLILEKFNLIHSSYTML